MKRHLVLALIVGTTLAATGVQAQTVFGARAGVNFSDFWGVKPRASSDFLVGTNVAAFATLWADNTVGFLVELGYSQKGAGFTQGALTGEKAVDYFEVGLLARMQASGGGISPFLLVGPVVSVEASCTGTLAESGASVTRDCDHPSFDGDAKTVPIDFGGALGAGIAVDAGFTTWLTDVRYVLGFNDIDDRGGVERNGVISFSIGVVFRPSRQTNDGS